MNSIGEFCEKEIDGKTFFIFTLSSQTDIPTSSSVEAASDDEDLPLQPLFSCPSLRRRVEYFKQTEQNPDSLTTKEENEGFVRFQTSHHFPSSDQQVQNMPDSHGTTCKLPLILLFHEKHDVEIHCNECKKEIRDASYYYCNTCCNEFHKECVECPLEIKHPSYPFQSLQLYKTPYEDTKCTNCEKYISNISYHLPTYNLNLHPVCALKPIPFVIDHLKRHPHPLSFFPKQSYLPCNVCGLIEEPFPTYICVRCVFVVHQNCIYFPHLIRISRHQHRISFTSSLPSGNFSCGVCRQKVDNNCGAYGCNKCGDYFFHSKCALRRDLWDGKELEGVPEEPDVDVQPFEAIADGIILHFSHEHRLQLESTRVYNEHNFCQACALPIYEGNYYSCMDQCEFLFHEACANFPRRKYHGLHRHPLTLEVVTSEYHYVNKGYFSCDSCDRTSCGFVYNCPVKEECDFQLDVRCASVTEPFEYLGHKHPLFMSLKPEEERVAVCQICNKGGRNMLNCIECEYVICFRCATLPYKARYKHDRHFLTFREGNKERDRSDPDWCDVCETKIVYSREDGFYSCDDCCITLHIDCLLGIDPYMKPGQAIKIFSLEELHILRNNTMSRPFCHGHEDRCQGKVVFKNNFVTLCSMSCINKLMASLVSNPLRENFGFKTLWENHDGILYSAERFRPRAAGRRENLQDGPLHDRVEWPLRREPTNFIWKKILIFFVAMLFLGQFAIFVTEAFQRLPTK